MLWRFLSSNVCCKAAWQFPCNVLCTSAAGWWSPHTDGPALYGLLTSSWLNWLLIVIPIGWIVHFVKINAIAVFVLVSYQQCTDPGMRLALGMLSAPCWPPQ